uniref:Uncharacterized protein n=1 Tax=Rhodosorus marinus TaxID=101924 RepID=A0A7S3EJU7_9RHOD|mmetsp:Transcript_42143/g.164787  ORF Transcript_42143/g.164787 Transcript_42143/m.164787 type:complete len:154 (+) Transcript_42143:259-720(+)|eukprot:CAMPEP_0113961704 /NCGR_PEP_ID=MMETSP0011_2-20120614/5477_1 /TAXON_ID=101924 /ORGANISM="Rhodosorus marinus" /LENGTH=153 /DNA_ID=CAMNT_0000973415 /DNA_START=64 /DNA_END=525 /DNA_ORIENTATION=+ /assembly_acc=CAM_ASM_000156
MVVGFVPGAPGKATEQSKRDESTCSGWKRRAKWKQGKSSGAVRPGTPATMPTQTLPDVAQGSSFQQLRISSRDRPQYDSYDSTPAYGSAAPSAGSEVTTTWHLWKGAADENIALMKKIRIERDNQIVQVLEQDLQYVSSLKRNVSMKLDNHLR